MKQDFFPNNDIDAAYNTCTRHDYQKDQVPQFGWKACNEFFFEACSGVVNDIARDVFPAAASRYKPLISQIPSKGRRQVA